MPSSLSLILSILPTFCLFLCSADKFRELLIALFHFDFKSEHRINKALCELLVHFVSVNALHLPNALELFVNRFRSIRATLSSDNPSQIDKGFLDTIHETIRRLCILTPTAPTLLLSILYKEFPHKRLDPATITDYVAQVLRLLEARPELLSRGLDMITERCLDMDVDIIITMPSVMA
ncbi:hypothetical protein EON64_16695, partial [archaeon]